MGRPSAHISATHTCLSPLCGLSERKHEPMKFYPETGTRSDANKHLYFISKGNHYERSHARTTDVGAPVPEKLSGDEHRSAGGRDIRGTDSKCANEGEHTAS